MQTQTPLKDAVVIAAKECGKTAAAVRELYRRAGGNPDKDHGRCKLTNEEEEILTAICTVYSICHQALTIPDLIYEANFLFRVEVSRTWAQRFLTRHHDEL